MPKIAQGLFGIAMPCSGTEITFFKNVTNAEALSAYNWSHMKQNTCRLVLFCAMTSTRSNWDYFYEQHQLCRKAEEMERRVGPRT